MLTKTCIICGQDFKTDDFRARYCSPECKREGQRLASAKWRDKHPDYAKKWAEDHPTYFRDRAREKARLVAEAKDNE